MADPKQPATPPARSDDELSLLRQMVQQQAETTKQQGELIAALTAALKTSGQANTVESIIVKQEMERQKQDDFHKEFGYYHNEPHARRSQIVVNARKDWTGEKLFSVQLGAPEFPRLVIRATDELHARARYIEACGILWVKPAETVDGKPAKWNHQYAVADVTREAWAQEVVQDNYEKAIAPLKIAA